MRLDIGYLRNHGDAELAMKCRFSNPDHNGQGKQRYQCIYCGRWSGFTKHEAKNVHRQCLFIGAGDWLAHLLLIVAGIDSPRFTALLHRLGIIRKSERCHCRERQERLNHAGWLVSKVASRLWRFVIRRSRDS